MPKPVKELGNLLKPVSALAIVPKSSHITRVGRQAYNSMLVLAQAQGEGAEFFEAPLSRILTGFAAAKDAAKEVKRHLRSMMTTLVEWQSPSPAETTPWMACVLLAEARLEKINGETWVRWAYPPFIRGELLNPQRYAQIKMQTVAQLRTHAAVALYEICARYRDNPSGVTSRQHWTWWLPVLTGAPLESRKTEYRFFKRDYIRPAIDDINETSDDLQIEVIEHKLGRSIDQIQFSVKKKSAGTSPRTGQNSEPMNVSQIVRGQSLGISPTLAEELHFRFGFEPLKGALDALEKRNALKTHPAVADPAAYVRTILNGNRNRNIENEPGETPAQTPAASKPSPPVPAVPPARAVNQPANDWESMRKAAIKQEIEALEPELLAIHLQQLKASLIARGGMQSVIRRIDAGNWKSPLVLSELTAQYARATYGQHWDKSPL